MKLVKGLEPPTYGLQIRCSTIELHQQQLNYLELNLRFYINKTIRNSQYFINLIKII